MAEVDVIINNRSYRISCNDGEENRVSNLAIELNKEVQILAEKIGQLGEPRMILLASLILLDKADEEKKIAINSLTNTSKKIEKVIEKIENSNN